MPLHVVDVVLSLFLYYCILLRISHLVKYERIAVR